MWKNKVRIARDFIIRHSKLVFPLIVIAAVAVTVSLALSAKDAKDVAEDNKVADVEQTAEPVLEPVNEDVPLLLNEDTEVAVLITNYYNAMALGDSETLTTLCDEISTKDMLRYMETAKYINSYPMLEIYYKPGFEEGTIITYVYYKVLFENQTAEFPGYQAHLVCKDEQGSLYLKRTDNSEEVNEYIKKVSAQDDVVEFNNRINVAYNELIAEQPELLEYLSELDSQVSTAVGEGLAQLAAQQEAEDAENAGDSEGAEDGGEQAGTGETEAAAPEEMYATATTTVNVRSSDSEQADKLGKVTGGSQIKVLEVRVNGWTKVLYERVEGYIKSEYLQMAESASNATIIGTVTATTNINVRVSPSETADKLGVLTGGETVDLIENADGWCKIVYHGQVAYVKADYVQ